MEQKEKSIITGAYNESGTNATVTGAPAFTAENSAPVADAVQCSWACSLHGPIDGKFATAPSCPECDSLLADGLDGNDICYIASPPAPANSAGPGPAITKAEPPATLKHFSTAGLMIWLQKLGSDSAAEGQSKLPPPIPRHMSSFLEESVCRTFIIDLLHDLTEACPQCGSALDGAAAPRFLMGKRCLCPRCNTWFTARTGTFLQGAQLSYAQVFLLAVLIDLMETGITPAKIAAAVGVSVDTVRNWQMKFRAFE